MQMHLCIREHACIARVIVFMRAYCARLHTKLAICGVTDNPELDAPVPAAGAPHSAEGGAGGGDHRPGGAGLQDVHLSGDCVHRRHRLPEPAGQFCTTAAEDCVHKCI